MGDASTLLGRKTRRRPPRPDLQAIRACLNGVVPHWHVRADLSAASDDTGSVDTQSYHSCPSSPSLPLPPRLTSTVTCATDIYNGPRLTIRPFHSVRFNLSVKCFPNELLLVELHQRKSPTPLEESRPSPLGVGVQRLRRAGGDSVRFPWSGSTWLRGPTQDVGFDFPCAQTVWSYSTFGFLRRNLRFR